jgi:hypothetical protein
MRREAEMKLLARMRKDAYGLRSPGRPPKLTRLAAAAVEEAPRAVVGTPHGAETWHG